MAFTKIVWNQFNSNQRSIDQPDPLFQERHSLMNLNEAQ